MPERRTVVSGRVLRHSGTFNAREMYDLIDQWFADNGFSDRDEVEHMEKITKNKKEVEIFYQPSKKVSDFVKIELRLLITISGLKRKVVEINGKSVGVNEGDLEIAFDGFVTTDYENREENKPEHFVWRTFVDKFIKKTTVSEFDGMISGYIQELYTYLRRYLEISSGK
ncbi:MAG: hypothetical protein ACOCUR_00450 [Nanoarchaeota archaeon]